MVAREHGPFLLGKGGTMPFKSDRQRRFFNSPTGVKKLGQEKVDEFNKASKGMDLPEKSPSSPQQPRPKTRYTEMMKGTTIE